MKKQIIAIGAAVLLTGCASGLSPVGYGLVTDVKGPVTATTNAKGPMTGTACAKNILGIMASGDASVIAAKRQGGITNISTVDYHSQGIYPFYGTTCVIVTGN